MWACRVSPGLAFSAVAKAIVAQLRLACYRLTLPPRPQTCKDCWQVMTKEPYASARRVFWIVDNGSDHRDAPAPVHRTLGWIRRSCQGCLGERGEVCSCFGRRAVGVVLE